MNKNKYYEKLEDLHSEFIGDIEQYILSVISHVEDSIEHLEGVEDLCESNEIQVDGAKNSLDDAISELQKLAEKVY